MITQQICKGALTARLPQSDCQGCPSARARLPGRPATFNMFCCTRTPHRCCRSGTSTPDASFYTSTAPPPAAEATAVRRRRAPLPKPAPAPPREPSPETAAPLVSPDDSPDEAQSPPRRMATVPRAPPPSPADAPYVMPPPPRSPPRTPPIAAPPVLRPTPRRPPGPMTFDDWVAPPPAERYEPVCVEIKSERSFVNLHAIEPPQLRGQRRLDGMESPRHRADATTGTMSRGAPEF